MELLHIQKGKKLSAEDRCAMRSPPAIFLLGPEQVGSFVYQQAEYSFTMALKRAQNVKLTLKDDESANGLVVLSGMAALDCQLFDYENQLGTEYLFGTVRCAALIEKLCQGMDIISDEREGFNHNNDFVAAFSQAVSRMLALCVGGARKTEASGSCHNRNVWQNQSYDRAPAPTHEPGQFSGDEVSNFDYALPD